MENLAERRLPLCLLNSSSRFAHSPSPAASCTSRSRFRRPLRPPASRSSCLVPRCRRRGAQGGPGHGLVVTRLLLCEAGGHRHRPSPAPPRCSARSESWSGPRKSMVGRSLVRSALTSKFWMWLDLYSPNLRKLTTTEVTSFIHQHLLTFPLETLFIYSTRNWCLQLQSTPSISYSGI